MELSIYDLLDIYKKRLYEDWNEKYADKFEFEYYLIAKIYIYDVPSCFSTKNELKLSVLLDKEGII